MKHEDLDKKCQGNTKRFFLISRREGLNEWPALFVRQHPLL